ncbi:hypothetical protein GOP47_0009208 [Adiantum capillus-veneris]|uniref:Uncharacterized protein n=1 Tax=Adiantum capillus-veneris TaxID=13818 RepID=A0A9D4UXD1_ADICA|nr:hypothetical protein GOP47_0009208 [Adiantum capillus-veneris]
MVARVADAAAAAACLLALHAASVQAKESGIVVCVKQFNPGSSIRNFMAPRISAECFGHGLEAMEIVMDHIMIHYSPENKTDFFQSIV